MSNIIYSMELLFIDYTLLKKKDQKLIIIYIMLTSMI